MVRVLVIDDERNLLLTLKNRVRLTQQPIEFICFGIDIEFLSSVQEEFEEDVADAFINYAKEKDIFDFDVILLDYALPKKNAKLILESLEEVVLPPIVMMSADSSATHKHILDILEHGQAQRYIYKNSPLFHEELTIYAKTLVEESYNHKIVDILEGLNHEEFSTFETFSERLAGKFMERLASTYVVIRKYDIESKTLIRTNSLEGVELQEVIDRDYDGRLFDVLESDEGYVIDNEFSLKGYPSLQQRFGDTIQSLIIRIGSKHSPQGIINIFKENKAIPLTNFLVKSIYKSIDNLNKSLVIKLEQTRIINKILTFLGDIMNESDEQKILDDYTKLIHERYNKNHARNKTTLKVLKPGNDRLELSCLGEACAVKRKKFEPTLTHNSISSVSFMENISILTIDSHNMDEVWERLQGAYLKMYGFEMDESQKVEFVQTAENIEMRAGLCIPISSFRNSEHGAVFGVLNLESEEPHYYNIKMMKELFNISQVVGGRIEAIRNQKLLDGLLESSRTLEYKSRLEIVTNVLKEYLGFFSLSLFTIENSGKLGLENIIIDDDEINRVEVQHSYLELLKDNETFKETALSHAYNYFKQGYSIFYLPQVENKVVYMVGKFNQDKELKMETKPIEENHSLKIYHQDFYKVKSYYAQAIRYKQELRGILVLGFKVFNPMINYDLRIIEKATELLGVIHLSKDEKFKDEMRDYDIQDFIQGFQSNFRHIVFNYYKDVEPFVDKEKMPEIDRAFHNILDISRHYDKIVETDSYKIIVQSIIDEFLIQGKQNNLQVEVKIEDDFKVFKKRKEFFYMIFFHLFSNAKSILETHKKPIVKVESSIKNDLLYIKVYDNGDLPNNSNKIFEYNYSERHTKGGFGLYHVRDKIENKDGEIVFLPFPKKHFRITLPLEKIGERYEE